MTAPGTTPRTTNSRSSPRRPIRRAIAPAITRATKIAAATPIVSQRTKPSPTASSGSKSNAMTASGTGASVAAATVSAGRHLRCRRPAHQRVAYATTLSCVGFVSLRGRGRRDGRGVARPGGEVAEPWGDIGDQLAAAPGPWGNMGRALFAVGRHAMERTPTLTFQLLGRLDVRAGGAPIRVTGRHAQALLGLLVIRPRLRLRDTIAAELWPEADGPSAASLRQALWLIRSAFSTAGLVADNWIETDQDSLGLRRDLVLDVDAERFGRLAASTCAEESEAALALYTGDLLEGLGHECFAAERERLSDQHEDLLAIIAGQR